MTFRRLLTPIALVAALLAGTGTQAATVSLNAGTGMGWVAIAPPGAAPNPSYPSPSPIITVGLAFEAANVGWNSSASYDASAWAAYNGGWINNASAGITPFYARKVFNIGGTPTAGTFTLQVDDDSQVWVNGTLVPGLSDTNMGTSAAQTANIASYLRTGDNVIAFKAHNSAGGGYGVFQLGGSVTFTPATQVPEPTSLALAGLGLAAAVGLRRRQRQPATA